MQLSSSGSTSACSGFVTSLDSGYILFHDAASTTEIAKCAMNSPAFAAAGGGTAAMETGTAVNDTATNAGTIDHAHFLLSDDTIMSQMTVTNTSVGTGEIQFSSVEFGSAETCTVTSLVVEWADAALT